MQRRKFGREFKVEAVRLVKQRATDRSGSCPHLEAYVVGVGARGRAW